MLEAHWKKAWEMQGRTEEVRNKGVRKKSKDRNSTYIEPGVQKIFSTPGSRTDWSLNDASD